jgi:hypothetical protein
MVEECGAVPHPNKLRSENRQTSARSARRFRKIANAVVERSTIYQEEKIEVEMCIALIVQVQIYITNLHLRFQPLLSSSVFM